MLDSYLPYEGKVVLRNKACQGIHVHIPRRVYRRDISCAATKPSPSSAPNRS